MEQGLVSMDGYLTNFVFNITSLSGGRITATFQGYLVLGSHETFYVDSDLQLWTLSCPIEE
jgi:hypothetical protein